MSTTNEKFEIRRKSGVLAAGLNILLPGLGYMYCGRVLLGLVVLPFVISLLYVEPMSAVIVWIILIIDGFLAANRFNGKLEN